ncbi:LPS biosynthesis related protein [Methanosarcina acetivorans C2A]|uniref:LPS biosynthesis related protein n=2 Tax=Methanosarcina acetivorans TaxID=2214 RepID=Q8TNE3_METAC|nr:LPS biosynthesis related protein [Methanosarcina acetivorans C2A]
MTKRSKSMRSIQIGMFSWESLHSIRIGGISPHVSELSEALAAKGHRVHLFTRGYENSDEIINGVNYHRIACDQNGDIVEQMNRMCNSMYFRFLEVRERAGEFDILHGHDWHPVNVLCRLKAQLGLPFVLTFHSTEWGRNGNRHEHWWEAKEISHREWLGGYEASEVITTSTVLKNEIQRIYQIPDYKIWEIPNGINVGKIKRKIDPGKVKKHYGIHPSLPVVLFTGRMSYQKGPDLLVEAAAKVLRKRDAHFMLIGEGDMRAQCEHRAQKLGIGNSCNFLGYAPDNTVIDWFNVCDLVCVPSRNEPFGIVVLEAWDVKKPVVASDAVALVENFKTGVISYKKPSSIAWGLNYVLEGLGNNRMGKKGHDLLKEKYNWKRIAEKTLETYEHVIDKK